MDKKISEEKSKKSILLRLPSSLADALAQWAENDLRSINGQIEYVLRDAVKKRTKKEFGE